MKRTLTISGMSCGHCVHAVKQALMELPGIDVLDVQIGHATVEATEDAQTDSAMKHAVEEEGFELVMIE